jgi:hypothetical protein
MSFTRHLTFVATLLATGASFANMLPEGSYPDSNASSSAVSRAVVPAEAVRWNSTRMPGLIKGEDRPEFVQSTGGHEPTRAKVIAEREAFARSGAIRIGNDA